MQVCRVVKDAGHSSVLFTKYSNNINYATKCAKIALGLTFTICSMQKCKGDMNLVCIAVLNINCKTYMKCL